VRIETSWSTPLLDPLLRRTLPAITIAGILTARFFPFEAVPPLCPMRRVTGIPCLGCGGTRSWVEMAHLQVGAAFIQSPLGAVCFLAALAMAVYLIGRSIGWLPAVRIQTNKREGFWLRTSLFTLLALHWLYLILSGVAN